MAWTVRVVRVCGLRSRDRLFPAEPLIEACLTDLAVHGHVAATTQNQAMPVLVCLDTRVLTHVMEGRIHAMRANKKIAVPVVMTREAGAAVRSRIDGTAPLGPHVSLGAACASWKPSSLGARISTIR